MDEEQKWKIRHLTDQEHQNRTDFNTCPKCKKEIPPKAWCEICKCCCFCCEAGKTIPTHVKIIWS